jgi:hypothetical protein
VRSKLAYLTLCRSVQLLVLLARGDGVKEGLLRWANVWPAEARAPPMSDCEGEFVERDRHSPTHRLRNRQLVVASPEILDEAMPGDDHPGAAVLLEATHRSQPRLQPTMVASTRLLAYRSVRCHAAGSNSSSTIG